MLTCYYRNVNLLHQPSKVDMKLTEDIIKNLPVLTEEEMKEISLTKEELIEKAIREFNEEADRIDEELDNEIFVDHENEY